MSSNDFLFAKKDLFPVVSEKLQEFRRMVLDDYPQLRDKNDVDHVSFHEAKMHEKWGEDFLKRHLNLLNYLT